MTEKELRKFSYYNRKRAWKEFYPEGNGKAKPGFVLHHKDPSWKIEDPIRYAEWRHDDLVMMTKAEHCKLHSNLNHQDEEIETKRVKNLRSTMQTSEYHEKHSMIMKDVCNKPEFKEKESASQKRRFENHDVIIQYSDTMKEVWKREGYRDNISKKCSETWKDPNLRKQASQTTSKKMSDPVFKEFHRSKVKEAMNAPEIKLKNLLAHQHLDWYNNGERNTRSKEWPGEGWVKGRLQKRV